MAEGRRIRTHYGLPQEPTRRCAGARTHFASSFHLSSPAPSLEEILQEHFALQKPHAGAANLSGALRPPATIYPQALRLQQILAAPADFPLSEIFARTEELTWVSHPTLRWAHAITEAPIGSQEADHDAEKP